MFLRESIAANSREGKFLFRLGQYRLEFKTFVNAFVRLPCQVIRTSRQLVYRLLGWNPHLSIFFRLVGTLNC